MRKRRKELSEQGKRLWAWAEPKYITQKGLAQALGYAQQGGLYEYLYGGRNIGNIMKKKLLDIGAPVEYIVSGREATTTVDADFSGQYPLAESIHFGGRMRPVRVESYRMLPGPKNENFKHAFYLRVEDDSMAPLLNRGDLVLTHQYIKPQPGALCVVGYQVNRLVIRRYKPDGNRVVLQVSSSEYTPNIVNEKDILFLGSVLVIVPKDTVALM